jgi:hypothetical protein
MAGMKHSSLQIGAKNLASLGLESACERCFWLRQRLNFKSPWSFFPSIFREIDAYSKKITTLSFARDKCPPAWMSELGEMTEQVPVPHWSVFNATDARTGIRINGMPDEIFRRPDGRLVILDYKCSKFTDVQDSLASLYHMQLTAYAWVARSLKLGETSDCALVYYEPFVKVSEEDLGRALAKDSHGKPNGFKLWFKAKVVLFQPDYMALENLLGRAASIIRQETPPAHAPLCADCGVVEKLAGAVHQAGLIKTS